MKRAVLENGIRSTGYYRQKALKVQTFLKEVHTQAQGNFSRFFEGPLHKGREKLLSIKGIGPETADSMLLYAGGKSIFVVDAYTKRIGTRWGVLEGEESYHEIQAIFSKALPQSVPAYGEAHALLVRLAKEHCQKKPKCARCPVKKKCAYGNKI